MKLLKGPCPSCQTGSTHLAYDGDVICSRCDYRERAPNVRRFSFASFKSVAES